MWRYNRALGLHICWVNGHLRFCDPLTGRFLGEYGEVKDERDIEREAQLRAEARANATESEIERLRRLLRDR